MGIERDEIDTLSYNARCDGKCMTYLFLRTKNVNTAALTLRGLGWKRQGYCHTLHHYFWLCDKCEVVH